MKHKMLYKVLSFAIVLTIIFTTFASAVTFNDISDHWAKEYIVKVANKGLVTGYDDGTFRPENSVTVLEALVMMSRLYEIDDDIKDQIIENYKSKLKNMSNASDYSWAFESLSVALELGVVSESGLETMLRDKSIAQKASKEEICVLLAKAMMLEDEVKNLKSYVLPFVDITEINEKARSYIYVMYDKDIVSGDNKKNINPKNNIKRAEMATMLDRAYDYIEDNKIEPEFSNYEPTTNLSGIITEVTEGDIESYVYIKEDDGLTTVVRINSDTRIHLNERSSEISKIKKDMLIECKINEQRIAHNIEVDNLTKIVSGKISNVEFSPPAKIKIINADNKKLEYSVPSKNMKIYLDGKETEFKKLEKGDLATLRIKDDVLYQIDSISKIQNYVGKITAIDYSNLPIKVTIKIKKDEKLMTFEYISDVEVTRNDEKSSFDQIRVGDEITLTAEYDKMIKINTDAAEAQIKGTIKEILIAPQVKIKIAEFDGSIKEYMVSNNVKINLGSKNATIYDLRLGYQVDVNTAGEEIVTIEAAEIQTAKSFSGKAIFINIDDKLIMMQNINQNGQPELIYIRVTNSTRMFDTSGSTKYLKDIDEGDNIMCTAVSQGGEYVAVSIMIQK